MKDNKLKISEFNTITELLKYSCNGRKDEILFIEEGKENSEVTYGQFEQDIFSIAGKLKALDVSHIGVVCNLSYNCILCLYAVIVAGKVLVPLSEDLSAEETEKYINKADIDLLIYNADRIDGIDTKCEQMDIQKLIQMEGQALTEWPQWEEERKACIFFTSGTEGEENGVVLTQKNTSYVNNYTDSGHINRRPRTLIFLPIHHVFSFVSLTVCIHDYCEIHLSRSIAYVALELEKIRPDVITTVPMINELFRSKVAKGIEESGKKKQIDKLIRLSNLLRKLGIDIRTPLFRKLRESMGGIPQLIITGASASSEETIRFFDDIGIIILQAYGLTETCAAVSTNKLKMNRIGSVGKPVYYDEIRIKDSEIQVKGGNVMKEYYKNPIATSRVFDGEWLKTGDLGYIDCDGYIYITGRKKNLIILDNGENVSPEELEKKLISCSEIQDVIVREKDGHIHAEIYNSDLSASNEDVLKNAVDNAIDKLNRENPIYKRIVSWEFRREAFEKTSTMKIRR